MGRERKLLYFLKPRLHQVLSSKPHQLGVLGETRKKKTGHKVGLPDSQAGRPLKIEKAGLGAGWHPRHCCGQKGQREANPASMCTGPLGPRRARVRER